MIRTAEICGVRVLPYGVYSVEKIILFMVRQTPNIRSLEVQERMKPLYSPRTVRRSIHRLVKEGKIIKFGERNPSLRAVVDITDTSDRNDSL